MAQKQEWLLLRSGLGEPAFNMAVDEALLESMPRLQKPALRFYNWIEPAASFGYFQKFAEVERSTLLRPLVRRPTGGGVVPHDADWTYSLVFPSGHEWYELTAIQSYQRAHQWVQAAFAKLGVETVLAPDSRKSGAGQCFEGHEKFDVLWHGRKIAGAAQRRTRNGLLIQGSVQPPPIAQVTQASWQKAMAEEANASQGVNWLDFHLDPVLNLKVRELKSAKYTLESYTRKR
jgi:lipoate-protein ligase A